MKRSEAVTAGSLFLAALMVIVMIIAMVVLNALGGCVPVTPAVAQNHPPFDADAAAPPSGPSDDCAASCGAWRLLRCPEANPSGQGAPCEEVCRNAASLDLDIAKDVTCAARARSCVELRACPD